jgi:hypothetical protein
MKERHIPEEMVIEIIENPDQIVPQGSDKMIYQSIKLFELEETKYLVRVFINVTKTPNLVITVYRTSKIEKYWQDED